MASKGDGPVSFPDEKTNRAFGIQEDTHHHCDGFRFDDAFPLTPVIRLNHYVLFSTFENRMWESHILVWGLDVGDIATNQMNIYTAE